MPSHDKLDPEQHAAVTAAEKTIAVLAGPGSGKTRTVANRANHLLATHTKDNVRLMTFTNKGAAEMKDRVLKIPGIASKRVAAGTFHTFGLGILRSHGRQFGLTEDFEIIDEDEQHQLCEENGSQRA